MTLVMNITREALLPDYSYFMLYCFLNPTHVETTVSKRYTGKESDRNARSEDVKSFLDNDSRVSLFQEAHYYYHFVIRFLS